MGGQGDRPPRIRARSQLGKYRIRRRIAEGGFAAVYQASDTIEGIPVALKVPQSQFLDNATLEELRREVRLSARLDHPSILPIKTAGFVDDVFVIVYPLGRETLADRLRRRLSARVALALAEQALEAVAFAHRHKVIHCDVKPENFILFDGNRLRLADFGIAKVALKTRTLASGQGTVGYMAPEQAMGRPSARSDVFSLGLMMYQMLSGELPVWPYEWPPSNIRKLRETVHPDLIAFLRRSIEVDERRRFRDAVAMLSAFRRLKARALRGTARRRRRAGLPTSATWKTLRVREFMRRYHGTLRVRGECAGCKGPVAETMAFCPWCGRQHERYRGPVSTPGRCPRCGRGVKRDWTYCAFCYGPGIQEPSSRRYPDRKYEGRCVNPACREPVMPFSRYCPWCRAKLHRKWRIEHSVHRCPACGWGVVSEFWEFCPWCGRKAGR